ncbi:MAG: hypothetical protein ACLR1T_12075 [Evtepia gabavorous]
MGLGLTREKLGDILPLPTGGPGGGAAGGAAHSPVPVGEGGAVPGAADPHPSGAAAPRPGGAKADSGHGGLPGWTLWRRRGSPFPGAGPPS